MTNSAEDILGRLARGHINHRFDKIEADLLVLKWMAAANFAATVAVLVRVYLP